MQESIKLLEDARNATALVLNDLRRQLDNAKARVDAISDRTADAKQITDNIEK